MTAAAWIALAGLALALVGTWAGAIIWAVRLEGRVNLIEALQNQFKDHVEKTHQGIEARLDSGFADIKADLRLIFERLEGKADKPGK